MTSEAKLVALQRLGATVWKCQCGFLIANEDTRKYWLVSDTFGRNRGVCCSFSCATQLHDAVLGEIRQARYTGLEPALSIEPPTSPW